MKVSRAIVLMVMGTILGACSYATELTESSLFEKQLSAIPEFTTLGYTTASAGSLTLDVFQPADTSPAYQGIVIALHGGGWEGGEPAHMYPFASVLTRLGWAVVVPQYRLAKTGETTIGNCLEDVLQAIKWVDSNREKFPSETHAPIVILGESAGGHLAALALSQSTLVNEYKELQEKVSGVILLNPITDVSSLSWATEKPGLKGKSDDAIHQLSPLHVMTEDSPPVLIMHGAEDSVVPVEQSVSLNKKLSNLGVNSRLRIWSDKGHGFSLYLPDMGFKDLDAIRFTFKEIEVFLWPLGIESSQRSYRPLYLFDGKDGFNSFSQLSEYENILYGTTFKGGEHGLGSVFSFDPETNSLTTLHSFSGEDGKEAFSGLSYDGEFLYGVCKFGGDFLDGTLFRLRPNGSDFKVLHNFNRKAQSSFYPHAAPVHFEGTLYGTVYHGGENMWPGVLYSYTLPDGPYKILKSLDEETGQHPAGQLLVHDGWLYGTLSDFYRHEQGKAGSLFRMRIEDLEFDVFHRFSTKSGGAHPYDSLTYIGEGNFVGTSFGEIFSSESRGSFFKWSSTDRQFSVLHDFSEKNGGGLKPNGALLLVNDHLYGTTHGLNSPNGGPGTLVRMKKDGSDFEVLHSFDSGVRGNTPMRTPAVFGGYVFGVTVFGGFEKTEDPETGGGLIYRYKID